MSKIAGVSTHRLLQRWRPVGWEVVQQAQRVAPQSGLSTDDNGQRKIFVPPLDCLEHIYVYLHEVGHVRLGHFDRKLVPHVEEYQAERFALMGMTLEGLPVPPWVRRRARDAVRWYCANDRAQLIKIKPHIARWCGSRRGDVYDDLPRPEILVELSGEDDS